MAVVLMVKVTKGIRAVFTMMARNSVVTAKSIDRLTQQMCMSTRKQNSNIGHKILERLIWYTPRYLWYLCHHQMKLERGFVGNGIVTVLYDSGVNVLAINRKLVPKSAYTGKYARCKTFSGRGDRFSQCRMFNHMPCYTGLAKLCSLMKPVADIIVGQLTGIKRCNHKEI